MVCVEGRLTDPEPVHQGPEKALNKIHSLVSQREREREKERGRDTERERERMRENEMEVERQKHNTTQHNNK